MYMCARESVCVHVGVSVCLVLTLHSSHPQPWFRTEEDDGPLHPRRVEQLPQTLHKPNRLYITHFMYDCKINSLFPPASVEVLARS